MLNNRRPQILNPRAETGTVVNGVRQLATCLLRALVSAIGNEKLQAAAAAAIARTPASLATISGRLPLI